MFSLVFMAPETEHIKKQHVHESRKNHADPSRNLSGILHRLGLS